jgi:methylated-DNA-protein-cysteine methyltransferase-like protein
MDVGATKLDSRERILAAIRAIPKGEVAGYGEVARRAGLPGRARLVARLLSQNEDRKLPWHRVLRSDGRIAFPEGSEGWREQCVRLRSEGVIVENGRVRGQRAAVTPEQALDAEIWGAPPPTPVPARTKANKKRANKGR